MLFHYDISSCVWTRVEHKTCRQFKVRREDYRHWSDDLDFGFKDFLTAEQLNDSQSDADDLYRRRELVRDGQRIEMHFDFDSLEIVIEGAMKDVCDPWLFGLKERLERACGASCAMIEREPRAARAR